MIKVNKKRLILSVLMFGLPLVYFYTATRYLHYFYELSPNIVMIDSLNMLFYGASMISFMLSLCVFAISFSLKEEEDKNTLYFKRK